MDEALALAAGTPAPPPERRQVSVLFADMVGYTAIVEKLGEEQALLFVRIIYQMLTTAVREHGCSVRSFGGDSIMAVFGIPEALEDAALRACRAALSIHTAFVAASSEFEAQFGIRPSVRVGVSTGIAVMAVVEGEGTAPTVVGDAVNLASRLQALAPSGECLICDDTRRLVEWLVDTSFHGEFAIKGKRQPQKLWRLTSIRAGATRFDASVGRGLSPYIGRADEMAELGDALDCARDRLCVIDLVAEPGLGKTRLVFEFLQRQKDNDVVVLSGQCAADGQQFPFLPFIEVVRGSFRIRPADELPEITRKIEAGLRAADLYTPENSGLLLNLLGLEPPEGSLSGLDGVLIGLRTRDLLPALLRARCAVSPVILIVEDIHWIDGASEQLLGKLIESRTQVNLLILQTRRPEYVPGWLGYPAVRTLALEPLAAIDIGALMQTRLGVDHLPDALVHQVTERAGGNPLFGEEILSFLIERGALRIESGIVEFDAALGESGLPASMQGLLNARINRLSPGDRTLLQAAAAIGRRFDPGLLSIVVGRIDDFGAALLKLQAQDLVYRQDASSDYVFKHVLLRDSVYQGLLSERRAELHLKIAQALEQRSDGRLAEVAETLAYHYSLTDRSALAFTYLAMSGVKSLGIFSLDEADRNFTEALALYDRDPAVASDEHFASVLANYALCCNISLRVEAIIGLANNVTPILRRLGDSVDYSLFLHHYMCCLMWNGRFLDALAVQQELSAMAARLGNPKALAYALVSEIAVSGYCAPLSIEAFEAKRREAEAALASVDDAYLQNFYLAFLGWDEVGRGRVVEARKAANRLMVVGVAMNDPRSLGYGTAMNALIAMVTDDFEQAFALAEEALSVSRVEFERAIATSAIKSALVPLNKPGAAEEVQRYVTSCGERGWTLFQSGPETMLGVALTMDGRIDHGIRHIKAAIARREREGYQAAADWYRLFLCEIYLAIISGEGKKSPGIVLRNMRSVVSGLMFGAPRILALVERVRANPQFDREGHYIGRTEMILGLLYKAKKKKVLATRHLTEARRIVATSGTSPMLTRIDGALTELTAAR